MDAVHTDTNTGGVPSAVIQSRHLPRRGTAAGRRRSFNHAIRASAKRLAQSESPCERLGLPCATDGASADSSNHARCTIRPHLETELRRQWNGSRPSPRLRCRHRPGIEVCQMDEEVEGRELARSEVPLPSDHFRLARRPTLEREDAFRDAATSARGKIRLRRSLPEGDDAQVAELYSMGLLYDDSDATDSQKDGPLSLNSIRHEQPVYSIRPDRRARRLTKSKGPGRDRPLYLDLSFSDLGDDTAIAQYLASPPASPMATDDHLPLASRHGRQQDYPPLRVIYELSGNRPTFDVDTSQPPDLVTDFISDYDCFSDSELDDTPSQREVHEGSDQAASDPWVILGDDLP
ncbi:hypothetical protein HIM_04106 [Hirsutella minnesotensis 3608]|uniref:Uncharacterized protein n=1 Tax=Hirsutella minnesotensis 3608 TaxID=1043627 RepID=A0A0F8A1P3_9HYPO|nr:hypothetical protein HIM_04106 [Hirsutella minnesotensis 3608]